MYICIYQIYALTVVRVEVVELEVSSDDPLMPEDPLGVRTDFLLKLAVCLITALGLLQIYRGSVRYLQVKYN